MKYCLICNNWEGNGSVGSEGTEAVAKYYLPKSARGVFSGWIPICKICAKNIISGGYFEIVYLKEHSQEEELGNFRHKFVKKSLINEEDNKGIFDYMECVKCGKMIKRYLQDVATFDDEPFGCEFE